jgi:hypothetical protein
MHIYESNKGITSMKKWIIAAAPFGSIVHC